MKKTIYKYPLLHVQSQVLFLPAGAKILCVQSQFDRPMLWALVDMLNNAPDEQREIEIYNTGGIINDLDGTKRKYISTFQENGGNYVFHAFEKLK